MKFYKYLYVGDTVKDPAKMKRKLKLHAGVGGYVISIAAGDDQLEIYKAACLICFNAEISYEYDAVCNAPFTAKRA